VREANQSPADNAATQARHRRRQAELARQFRAAEIKRQRAEQVRRYRAAQARRHAQQYRAGTSDVRGTRRGYEVRRRPNNFNDLFR
jgi:hypothetical protein